ncbi:MAG: MBL fold metallo-hydrolase [Candidatus Omnitrophica bacterium]|nr:MBL fold metallo-hydrolase [Candidatus Omnitrophota bacterium]
MGFIKFLGTAGARFVMIKQLRSSAGIWMNYKSTNILIDPGPGSIVRCNTARPKLDPGSLDAIILTHKHLDHSGDINVMIEAMTQGGFKKKGKLFIPSDAIGRDGVVLPYLKDFVEEIIILREGAEYSVGDIKFNAAVKNIHSVETYGIKFFVEDEIISFVSDTKYFPELINVYNDSTILILNVVFYEKKGEYDHLCIDEAIDIVKTVRPKKTVLTHFGMTMLKQKPYKMEKEIRNTLALHVQMAYDGYQFTIPFNE